MMIDISIVGGGVVGASLAAALADSPLAVTLIEPRDLALPKGPLPNFALAPTSQRLLTQSKAWPKEAATPIYRVQVSTRGHWGRLCLQAKEFGLPALGYVLPGAPLLQALYRRLQTADNIHIRTGASVTALQRDQDGASLLLSDGTRLDSRLVVVADGRCSQLRAQLGITCTAHTYPQHAIVWPAKRPSGHAHIAYERFTPQGAFAVLPLLGNKMSVIGLLDQAQASHWRQQSPEVQFAAARQALGPAFADLQVTDDPIFDYPLHYLAAHTQVAARTVLLGNAAHTVNPIAAQGLNLSLRGVAGLVEQLCKAWCAGEELGAPAVLAHYAASRKVEQRQVLRATHWLAQRMHRPDLQTAAGFGLALLSHVSPLRRRLAQKLLGLAGSVPALACGQALQWERGYAL